ncbi:hypothetical protein E8F11_05585 [Pseudomonas sp. BN417]|uniref:hypothetical protein n=1 Tax=Pseudomonas sp. BN417 TaxID=2567890 RepID=UPI0024573F8E|nr:hypothetical protein [Pseudomonas sp. BN417]MDH4554651.1 hypothetical protein [Pseudomonas sp. BN417]
MENPFIWAEIHRLSLNISATHIAMVAFLERAMVPWSDDQVVEFERISAAEVAAINEYRSFLERRCGGHSTPRKLPSGGRRQA